MAELPRRNPDGTFNSATDAYEFGVTILQIRRGAKAINCDPDRRGSTGQYGEYAQLDAITILGCIEAHDLVNGRASWFADYYFPDPCEPPPRFTVHEMRRLTERTDAFECDLCDLGFLGQRCKTCHRKKKLTTKRDRG